MTTKLIHVLLVFNHLEGRLEDQRVFETSAEALAAYGQAESDARERKRIEVVLIGSDSLETIRRTHANYYDGTVAKSEFLVGL